LHPGDEDNLDQPPCHNPQPLQGLLPLYYLDNNPTLRLNHFSIILPIVIKYLVISLSLFAGALKNESFPLIKIPVSFFPSKAFFYPQIISLCSSTFIKNCLF
jgi:hypothetical protein